MLLQEGGSNFQTPDEFFDAAKTAYSRRIPCARFGAQPPTWLNVEASHDFKSYIKPYRNKLFGGIGHCTQLQVDEVTGEVYMGRRGSEVHFLHFYNYEGALMPKH